VKIWDFEKSRCVQTLVEHTQAVWDIAYMTDHPEFIASCSMDHNAKLWDLTVGRCRQTFRGHVDSINSIVFQPFANVIATASGDKTLSLWDCRSGLRTDVLWAQERVQLDCVQADGRACRLHGRGRHCAIVGHPQGRRAAVLVGVAASGQLRLLRPIRKGHRRRMRRLDHPVLRHRRTLAGAAASDAGPLGRRAMLHIRHLQQRDDPRERWYGPDLPHMAVSCRGSRTASCGAERCRKIGCQQPAEARWLGQSWRRGWEDVVETLHACHAGRSPAWIMGHSAQVGLPGAALLGPGGLSNV